MPLGHILLLTFVAALWGVNFVVIRIGLDHFPPLLFTALRFACAALPLAFVIRRPPVPLWLLAAIGLSLGAVKFSLLFLGMEAGLPPGIASLVLQAQAFFTVLFAALVLGERPGRLQVAGIALALAGVGLIATTIDGSLTVSGLALCLGAAVAWAVANLLIRRAGPVDMLGLMVWISLVPPLPLLILSALFEGGHRDLAAIASTDWQGIAAVLTVAYVATILGFGIWGAMIARHGAGAVAPFSLLVPIFGMSSAALFLGEPVGPIRLAAAALILAGLAVNTLGSRRAAAARAAALAPVA